MALHAERSTGHSNVLQPRHKRAHQGPYRTNCPPSIQCPPDMTIPCPGPNGVPLNYEVGVVNCGQNTTIVCNPPSGSIIYGPTNVCCRLLSSTGLTVDQCCFKVTVQDTVPPI